jgi:hypothetical protein
MHGGKVSGGKYNNNNRTVHVAGYGKYLAEFDIQIAVRKNGILTMWILNSSPWMGKQQRLRIIILCSLPYFFI